jgi:hypothetical protein
MVDSEVQNSNWIKVLSEAYVMNTDGNGASLGLRTIHFTAFGERTLLHVECVIYSNWGKASGRYPPNLSMSETNHIILLT